MGRGPAVLWLVAVVLCWNLWSVRAQDSPLLYKDPTQSVDARVQDLLGRMTLAEKIGQMTQIERSVANESVMRDHFIGSVLNGGGSTPGDTGTASALEWADMVDSFQRGALSTRLGIPYIYGIDAVHGNNNVFGATLFPHNVGLGATRDPDLLYRIGQATALEVRATGIPWAFAPCIAVCRDPRWGRCYESFSEDTETVESLAKIVSGLQGSQSSDGNASRAGYPAVGGQNSIASCAKHFVGDGGTTNGINENNTQISFKSLVRIHMRPYFSALDQGVSTIMISYSSWNGKKMHANRFLVTHVLKQQLGFKGFVVSDWQGLDRITSPAGSNYTYSVLVGINAGIDMVMVPYDYPTFLSTLTDLVNRGFISTKRIDDAVTRILRVKFILGLFEHPYADRSYAGYLGQQSHRDLAREAVRKSLVLLKNGKNANDPPFVPLDRAAPKILVAGAHANDVGLQCGGWSISWQGAAGNNWTTGATTILQGIQKVVSPSTQVVYEPTPDASFAADKGFSYAIVVVGEQPYAETFGDNLNLTIPAPGPDTITNVCTHIKCVVVLISGRPLVVEPYLPIIDSFVAAWLPGSEAGYGVADVLFGDYDFVGKSPRTWFKNVDQLPMNVGDKNYDPLFAFGYGLSYPV